MESSRLARSADLETLIRLGEAARQEARNKRGGDMLARLDSYLDDIPLRMSSALTEKDYAVVVGTVDEIVVGYGIISVKMVADKSLQAVVEELFVDPEARAIGVGEAIADSLLEIAVDSGAIGVDALALPGDRETKNFFESFGMKARAIVVHRKLEKR